MEGLGDCVWLCALLIDKLKPPDDRIWHEDSARRKHCIGSDARTIPDERSEFDSWRRGASCAMLVSMIANDGTGFQVHLASDDGIAHEIEVSQHGTGEHE